ncbi:MAG: hypothetical protein Q8R92_15490 [Deltaproteobacteria bacterium]|nr:hypothetical protein [Deltaproteobacteria bacterium]
MLAGFAITQPSAVGPWRNPMSKVSIGPPGIKVSPEAAVNIKVGQELMTAREECEGESDQHVDRDPLEPPQLEDKGDSTEFVEDEPPGSSFELPWKGKLPLMHQIPKRLRPPLRYRIDGDLTVHPLYRERSKSEDLEHAVAEAIAVHLWRTGVRLVQIGDWCRIPSIGSDDELAALIPGTHRRQLTASRIHAVGNVLKDFAIELPSRDVVTPQALIDIAKRPQVRYQIDGSFVVHKKRRRNVKREALEQAVAQAIARHLQNTGYTPNDPGDWRQIPGIGADFDLAVLVPESHRAALVQEFADVVKAFAVELPNGDKVTPGDLIEPNSIIKRTTRGAALRLAAQRPEAMPSGETWSSADWDAFEDTQRRKEPKDGRQGGLEP